TRLKVVSSILPVAMVLIGIAWIPVIRGATGLYSYLQAVQGYLAPPIFVVFFFGIFFRLIFLFGDFFLRFREFYDRFVVFLNFFFLKFILVFLDVLRRRFGLAELFGRLLFRRFLPEGVIFKNGFGEKAVKCELGHCVTYSNSSFRI
ncbi:MAG TPA: hypothetical protein PKX38_05960, partial [Alphaproteobacteria bacterium]|nr:hypothetical protein [Alphaproteobacteria bacterium]